MEESVIGSPFEKKKDTTQSISAAASQRLSEIKKKYPDPKSAIMPALYIAQEEIGYISQVAIDWVAKELNLAPVHVMEVASFYTMYYKKPVGKYHFQVCRTLSCALRGAKNITQHLKRRLNLNPGEVSKNGMWSYEEVECLGSCGTAPMCQVNDCFFENLNPEKMEQLINRIESEKPDLRLSTLKDELGAGLKGMPKSEVI